MEERYREYLDTLPLTTLRVLGRHNGVPNASSDKKTVLVDGLIARLTGKCQPVKKSNRGAPPKQDFVDPSVISRLNGIRLEFDSETENYFEVASPERIASIFDQPVYTGILEITQNGYGFLRANNCQPSSGGDVFIPSSAIHEYRLREGDFVACNVVKPRQKNDSPAVGDLLSVNGMPLGQYENRPHFDELTACYPKERIALSSGGSEISLRILDLFAPIGKGQRALIIAPPKAGKTTLVKEIARSVASASDLCLIILLVDERPEEVTDIRSAVEGTEVIYSTFDEEAEHHIRAAELTIAHAKRLAESGKDVVILLDSLTKLTRAYNYVTNTGKILSGGLDAGCFSEPKRFLGTARNTLEAGSVTILATALVDTGSRMDDVIYEEFKGTGNSDIFLSRELAEKRIFPAIDIRRSGTRREELLLTEKERAAVHSLRGRGITDCENIADMMRKTTDNEQFIAKLSEWLKVYRNNSEK